MLQPLTFTLSSLHFSLFILNPTVHI